MARRQLPPQIAKLMVTDRRTRKPVVRYEMVVDAGRDPETGKRHQVRRRFRTEQEARKALAEIQDYAAKGDYVPCKDATLAEVIDDWVKSLHWARKVTIEGYKYNVAPVRERYGTLAVQKLSRKHLDDLIVALRAGGTVTEKGQVRRPWAPRSLNRVVGTMEMVLDYARDRKLLTRNVAGQIKSIPRRNKKPATYTGDEVRKVLESVAEDRNEHVWYLALRGLRRSELGGLRWRNIDFEDRTLKVEIGRASAGGEAVEDAPKTETSERTLPMDDDMVEMLRRTYRRQAAEKLSVGEAYGEGGYVVCDEAGNPYHPDTLTHKWAKVVKAAGVRHIRLHDCRHTAGTTMHLLGVPIAVIAAWLGHADASFTQRTYAHSQDEALKAAAKRLGAVVTTRDIEAG